MDVSVVPVDQFAVVPDFIGLLDCHSDSFEVKSAQPWANHSSEGVTEAWTQPTLRFIITDASSAPDADGKQPDQAMNKVKIWRFIVNEPSTDDKDDRSASVSLV
jgi:hypothetical protein